MTVIVFVSVINHYHVNGLHLFWDTSIINVIILNLPPTYTHRFFFEREREKSLVE